MEKDDWIKLIRRSLGVPDLIPDPLALEFMGDSAMATIAPEMAQADFSTQGRTSDASHALIDDIATAGSEGKLDEFLLGLSRVDFDSVAAEVIAKSKYGSPTTGEATKHVLERIDHFVSGHKFQAECGCYFN